MDRHDLRIESVAADQAMGPKLPDVADPAAGRHVRRRQVLLGRAGLLRCEPLDEAVDLGDRKAGDADVEVEIDRKERLQLLRQDLLVPAGVEGELVIGDHVGPLLLGRHRLEPHARDLPPA
jgi:hypothetical protein